jgi:hypothetical protein
MRVQACTRGCRCLPEHSPQPFPPAFIAFAILATLPRTPGAFVNVEKGHTGVQQTRIHRRR